MQKVKLTFKDKKTDEIYVEIVIAAEFIICDDLQESIAVEVVQYAAFQKGVDVYVISQLVEF